MSCLLIHICTPLFWKNKGKALEVFSSSSWSIRLNYSHLWTWVKNQKNCYADFWKSPVSFGVSMCLTEHRYKNTLKTGVSFWVYEWNNFEYFSISWLKDDLNKLKGKQISMELSINRFNQAIIFFNRLAAKTIPRL